MENFNLKNYSSQCSKIKLLTNKENRFSNLEGDSSFPNENVEMLIYDLEKDFDNLNSTLTKVRYLTTKYIVVLETNFDKSNHSLSPYIFGITLNKDETNDKKLVEINNAEKRKNQKGISSAISLFLKSNREWEHSYSGQEYGGVIVLERIISARYGIGENIIDVTKKFIFCFLKNSEININKETILDDYFGDPAVGKEKNIMIDIKNTTVVKSQLDIKTQGLFFKLSNEKPFEIPKTVKEIYIYNPSNVTKELDICIYDTISSHTSLPVKIVNSFETENEFVLYIILTPIVLVDLKPVKLPKYFISYQLEPLISSNNFSSRHFSADYIGALKKSLWVWDYNPGNIDLLNKSGITNVSYVPIGYHNSFTNSSLIRLYDDDSRNIDVLFLGWSASPRRSAIKKALEENNISHKFINSLSHIQMKNEIVKAKICLNMHFDNISRLETVRLSLLLSNYSCIVSEYSVDKDIDKEYEQNGVYFCNYEDIISSINDLLLDENKRSEMAKTSFEWYTTHRIFDKLTDFNKLIN